MRRQRWDLESPLVWIVLFLVVGLVLHLVGFSTDYWVELTVTAGTAVATNDTGLWNVCEEKRSDASTITQRRTCHDIDKDGVKSYHEATQALQCLGLVCYILVFPAVYFVVDARRKKDFKTYRMIAVFLMLLSGLFITIGVIIFLAEYYDEFENIPETEIDVGYSSALCLTGGIVVIFCAVAFLLLIKPPREKRREKYGYPDVGPAYLPPPAPMPMVQPMAQPAMPMMMSVAGASVPYTAVVPTTAGTMMRAPAAPPTNYATMMPPISPYAAMAANPYATMPPAMANAYSQSMMPVSQAYTGVNKAYTGVNKAFDAYDKADNFYNKFSSIF